MVWKFNANEFQRKASNWNIIGFLNECDLEPYRQKIEEYIISLEMIVRTEKRQRKEQTWNLMDNYKKGKLNFVEFYRKRISGMVEDLHNSSLWAEPQKDSVGARWLLSLPDA